MRQIKVEYFNYTPVRAYMHWWWRQDQGGGLLSAVGSHMIDYVTWVSEGSCLGVKG